MDRGSCCPQRDCKRFFIGKAICLLKLIFIGSFFFKNINFHDIAYFSLFLEAFGTQLKASEDTFFSLFYLQKFKNVTVITKHLSLLTLLQNAILPSRQIDVQSYK